MHDYFFAKSVDALKPGGVLALVTSHFTLDKQNAAIREYLAERADFVGAIRLPSDAFKREGTAVVTDIVFLRKRAAGEPANHVDPEWLGVAPLAIDGAEVPINRYFHEPSGDGPGQLEPQGHAVRREGYSVTGNGDLAEQLRDGDPPPAGIRSVTGISQSAGTPATAFTPPPPLTAHHRRQLSSSATTAPSARSSTGRPCRSSMAARSSTADGTMTGKRLAALIGLRDRARRVLQSQNEGWPEADRDDARRELNSAYDRFVSAYGPINKTTFGETKDGTVIRRMPNLVKFREDPDAMLVMSLEDYDEVTGKATKAAIMQKDVVGKNPPITKVASAEEGLLVSLNQRGAVDLPFIATLYGKPEEQIIAELGDLIYHDPESQNLADRRRLSLRQRAGQARRGRAAGSDYARNAEALRAVQPEDVLPGDIDANLGAPWIPESDIQAFAAELFHVEPEAIQVAPPEERRGVERRGRVCRRAVGGRDVGIRHAASQRHLAV